MSDLWIRASEITEYTYCRRSWWLRRVQGHVPENQEARDAGNRYHGEHAALARRARQVRRLAYGLLALTGLTLIIWLAVL